MTPYEFTIDRDRCRIIAMGYQRNGVGGAGFWSFTILASFSPERPLTAFYFPEGDDENVSDWYGVIDANDLTRHWRGDHFVDELRACVRAREEEHWQSYAGNYHANV